jgi:hypothetical protein
MPRKRGVGLNGSAGPLAAHGFHFHEEGAGCKGEAPPRPNAPAAYQLVIDG